MVFWKLQTECTVVILYYDPGYLKKILRPVQIEGIFEQT